MTKYPNIQARNETPTDHLYDKFTPRPSEIAAHLAGGSPSQAFGDAGVLCTVASELRNRNAPAPPGEIPKPIESGDDDVDGILAAIVKHAATPDWPAVAHHAASLSRRLRSLLQNAGEPLPI